MRRLRTLLVLFFAAFLLAYTGVTSWPSNGSTDMARGDLEALKGAGKLVLSGADPGWGTTNAQLATRSDFTTYFQNNGSCAGTSLQILTSAQLQACATVTSVHTPIFANNTFSGGSLTSWTSAYVSGGCSTGTFGGIASGGQDGNGYAAASSGVGSTCSGSIQSISQTVSISGTPTAQSLTFYYWVDNTVVTGGGTCGGDSAGSASYQVVINGTNAYTAFQTMTHDGAWHSVSLSLPSNGAQLVSGSNTIKFEFSITRAMQNIGAGCTSFTYPAETAGLDVTNLTATY